jgi:hypothetical protein
MAEMLTLSAVLLRAAGRFWDPDSDSECEDLRDAEELHPPESCSPMPLRTDTAVTALPMTGQRPARSPPSTPMRQAKPPWRLVWKGLLRPDRKDFTGCHAWGFFAAGVEDGGGTGRRHEIDWVP